MKILLPQNPMIHNLPEPVFESKFDAANRRRLTSLVKRLWTGRPTVNRQRLFQARKRPHLQVHAEVGCSGVLFNDPYGIPAVVLDNQAKSDVKNLMD